MIVEQFVVKNLTNKIKKVKEYKTSNLTPCERDILIGEIVMSIIFYIFAFIIWIIIIKQAFKKKDIIWGILIIFFGLPMALWYFIFLYVIKHDRSFKKFQNYLKK